MPTADGMIEREHGAQTAYHAAQEGTLLPGGPALGQVRRDDRHDGDRDDAVGQLEEGVGVGVGRHGVRPGHAAGQDGDDEQRHLVGQHEAERPPTQARHGAQRLVPRIPAPAQQSEVGAAQARDERHALEHHSERRAQPEEDQLGVVVLDTGQRGVAPGPQPEPHQDPDADDVVDDRGPGDGDEAAPGVEQCGRQHEEAVGGDLDHEPAQEPGGDLALEQHTVDLVRARVRIEHGERVDEERRRHECRHGRDGQDDHRDREHGRNGVEGFALALVGQPVDEDGNEGGREDAAQHDVVEHVGRGVGEVVRVGQRRLPEGPGEGDEAEQSGDAETPVPTAT